MIKAGINIIIPSGCSLHVCHSAGYWSSFFCVTCFSLLFSTVARAALEHRTVVAAALLHFSPDYRVNAV